MQSGADLHSSSSMRSSMHNSFYNGLGNGCLVQSGGGCEPHPNFHFSHHFSVSGVGDAALVVEDMDCS